ncbi:hypothetical protein QVD17_01043 [Tagetes erecta]|uniref:Uncharacterized protein n=1 Tax=Tagetes erecta TaxID=13708 RepID=A0AAD8LBE5_TARER|nr:hypothetical protein QVD17_01043 [Tagetes erecta]
MWFSQFIDIDLSSNNFSGSIPNVSSGLQRLDLSHNKFYGQISFLCQITYGSLYFLDLSNNSFIGEIPDCLWHFKELQVLNLGHNKFSGRLPISIGYLISLESFDPLRYIGNVGLCGLPLTKYCPGDKELEAPIIGQNEGGGEGIDELDRLFLIGGASGFATGFWMVCCGLHVNWHGRNEFFRFLDNVKDWVYIKVTLFIARQQRAPWV